MSKGHTHVTTIYFSPEHACINIEIFGNVNAVGFLLKPELASVSMYIGEGKGVEVSDVTIYLKEVIITLI